MLEINHTFSRRRMTERNQKQHRPPFPSQKKWSKNVYVILFCWLRFFLWVCFVLMRLIKMIALNLLANILVRGNVNLVYNSIKFSIIVRTQNRILVNVNHLLVRCVYTNFFRNVLSLKHATATPYSEFFFLYSIRLIETYKMMEKGIQKMR